MRGRTLGLVHVCLLLGACGDGTVSDQQRRCFDLVESARFGDAEVHGGGLDQRTVNAGAGVLGNVRGVTTSPDGSLWVLDGSWYKIAIFGSEGSFRRLVLGGLGDGPGEFRIPQDLVETSFGVSVLDYDLRRFTLFAWSGELLDVVSVPETAPYRHLVQDERIWTVPFNAGGPSTGPIVLLRNLHGEILERGPTLGPEDQSFGVGYGIAEGSERRVLVSTARPGVWMEYLDGSWIRRGSPLFPNDQPPFEEQVSERVVQVTPSQYQALSIGMLGDSIVIQGISALPEPFDWNNPPERGTVTYALAVFDPTGGHIHTISLPEGVTATRLHVDRRTGHLYMVSTEPFPQVVEFELTDCGELA